MHTIPSSIIPIPPANKLYLRVLVTEAQEFGREMLKHLDQMHRITEPTVRKYTLGGVTFEYTAIQEVQTDPGIDGAYCMIEIKYYNK